MCDMNARMERELLQFRQMEGDPRDTRSIASVVPRGDAFPCAAIDANLQRGQRVSIRSDGRMLERFSFSDLRELFAKANEEKSGDQLAGIAARSERERVAAKRKLADLSLAEIVQQPLIDPADDDVSRLMLDTFDREAFAPIQSMTVGELLEHLLDDPTTEPTLKKLQAAPIPESPRA